MRSVAVFVAVWGLGCRAPTPLEASSDTSFDGSFVHDAEREGDAGGAREIPNPALPECSIGQPCPGALVCLGGRCQDDPCDAMTTLCTGGRECVARCVSTQPSLCAGGCGPRETCFRGICTPGCFPSPCDGVVCGAGQHCDASRGHCIDTVTAPGTCPDGHVVHLTCVFPDACADVSCADGERCISGVCVDDPCAGVHCADRGMPTGSCVNGVCIDTCDCGGSCPTGRCILGRCECERSCPADGFCGAPDGCGGLCDGECPGGEFCVGGVCRCAPLCPSEAACGAIDPRCGVRCDVGVCPEGQACRDGECRCAPRCDGATCGAPDGCGGYCHEGQCGIGEFCDTGVCVPTYCDPGCGCGEACVRGTCRPICAEGQTPCGCSGCCDAGTICDPRTGTCSLEGPF